MAGQMQGHENLVIATRPPLSAQQVCNNKTLLYLRQYMGDQEWSELNLSLIGLDEQAQKGILSDTLRKVANG